MSLSRSSLFSPVPSISENFVLSGYLIQRFMIFSKNLKNKMQLISKIGGGLLLITGILMITNQLQALGYYILEYIPVLGNFG